MKILHVNNNFHFLGGTEQYLYSICHELNQLGCRNIVIHGSHHDIAYNNTAEKHYPIPFLDDFNTRLKTELKSQVKSILDNEDPDIVYLHNIHNPYIVEVLTELKPVVKYVHDHESYCPKGIRIVNDSLCTNSLSLRCAINAFRGNGYRCMGRRSQPLEVLKKIRQMLMNRRAHRNVKKFVVASNHMKNNLLMQGYQDNRIAVIPYFTVIPDDITEVSQQNNILFVGRISPEKGLDIFIESLELLEADFRFIIVGDGSPDYVDMLHNKVREKKLEEKVEFSGWVDNRHISEYYAKSAFLVVPSIWPEPFGIVGIEAMAHSRPAISFNVGGIPEWLEHEKTGFLIERMDIKDFARKMNLLLRNKSLRHELGQNAYKRVSTIFNKTNHIQNLIHVFNEVLNKGK